MPDRKFSLQTLIASLPKGWIRDQPRFFGRLCEMEMVRPAFSIGWAKAGWARQTKVAGACPAALMLRVSCVRPVDVVIISIVMRNALLRTSWKDRWRLQPRPGKAAGHMEDFLRDAQIRGVCEKLQAGNRRAVHVGLSQGRNHDLDDGVIEVVWIIPLKQRNVPVAPMSYSARIHLGPRHHKLIRRGGRQLSAARNRAASAIVLPLRQGRERKQRIGARRLTGGRRRLARS